MGLYDRDYAHDTEPGFHLQPPRTITTQLVVITACVYALQIFVQSFSSWFALDSYWFRQPWNFYRLLSYGFLHDPKGIEHVLVNMFMLWMFGREVEQRYGRREFLLFYLWAVVFAGLFWSFSEASMGRTAVLVGASGGVVAIFVLYALNFPRREVLLFFIVPVPVWIAALLVVGWDVYGAIQRTGVVACTAHLAGAVAGLYYYKFAFSPFAWIVNRFSGVSLARKPKLRIHEPTEPGSEFEEEVDRILKKIQDSGQDSLTVRERRILQQASQEYQRKRQ